MAQLVRVTGAVSSSEELAHWSIQHDAGHIGCQSATTTKHTGDVRGYAQTLADLLPCDDPSS